MEKPDKVAEPGTRKSDSTFVTKLLLFVLCVIAIIQFAVVVKNLASLNALNKRLDAMDKEIALQGSKSLINENEHASRRAKRSSDNETGTKTELLKLVEARLHQAFQNAAILRGPPGKPGKDGTPGSEGKPGKDGTSGRNGRDGRDGSQGSRGEPGVPGQRGPAGSQGPKGTQGEPGNVGVTYIRWGKKTCPNTGATLVYEGHVGGSSHVHSGGGSNYVCLTRDPIYEKYQSGYQDVRSRIFGAEYETYSTGIFPSSLYQHDVPCAVCHVIKRASQMMIPGRNVCPAGWTREYKGYLMAEYHGHHRTMYTCVDANPDYTRGTHANHNGALFYFTEGNCGSLPCKPYIAGQELTCAVCTR